MPYPDAHGKSKDSNAETSLEPVKNPIVGNIGNAHTKKQTVNDDQGGADLNEPLPGPSAVNI